MVRIQEVVHSSRTDAAFDSREDTDRMHTNSPDKYQCEVCRNKRDRFTALHLARLLHVHLHIITPYHEE